MDSRRYNELIAFLVSKTGWTLEYIRGLPLNDLTTLLRQLRYQHDTEIYTLGSYAALPAVMMARKGTRLSDLIGQPPLKGGMQMPETNLAKEPPPQIIKLSDGKDYTLASMNLNILADVEDKFDKPFAELLKTGRMRFLRYILFLRLKPNYPALTEEQVGKLVDISLLNDVSKMYK